MIFRFLHPWFFLGFLLVPLLAAVYLWIDKNARARVIYSDISSFKSVPPSLRVQSRHIILLLRLLALTALITAIARPQYGNRTQEVMSKGIDIMIVLDNSRSMTQQDMSPNRLESAKKVILDFIEGREKGLQNDRIGLVEFAQVGIHKMSAYC